MELTKEEIELDKWELELQIKKRELQNCQKQQGVDSCLKCSQLLNCKLRDSFVHAVYSSMNKGTSGGFEF